MKALVLGALLLFPSLFTAAGAVESSLGVIVTFDVKQGFLILDDEQEYTLPDSLKDTGLAEGDTVSLTWDWVNDVAVIRSIEKQTN